MESLKTQKFLKSFSWLTYVKGMLFQSQLSKSIIVEYIEKNICDWFDSMSEPVVKSLLFIIILNC